MRSFKKLWSIGRVLLFWYSAAAAAVFIIATIAALFGQAGGLVGTLLEYVLGKDFLEGFPKKYFTVCVTLACISLVASNIVCCVVLKKRKDGLIVEKISRIAFYLMYLGISAVYILFMSVGLLVAGALVFLWIYVTNQPPWISGPCALLAGFMLLISVCYSENNDILPIPQSWYEYFSSRL